MINSNNYNNPDHTNNLGKILKNKIQIRAVSDDRNNNKDINLTNNITNNNFIQLNIFNNNKLNNNQTHRLSKIV